MSNITSLIDNKNINSLDLSKSQREKAQKFLNNDQRKEVLVLFNGKLKVMKAKSGKPLDYRIANMALSVFNESAMGCEEIQAASRLHFNRKRLSYTTQLGETKDKRWDSKSFSTSNPTNTLIVQAEIAEELHYFKQTPQDINSAFTEISNNGNATLSEKTKTKLQGTYHTDFPVEVSDKLFLCKLVQNQLLNQLEGKNPALFNLVSFSLDRLLNSQTLSTIDSPERFIEWMQTFLGTNTIFYEETKESVLKITDVTNRIFDQLKHSKDQEHDETGTIQLVLSTNADSPTSLSTHKAPPPPQSSTTSSPTPPPISPPASKSSTLLLPLPTSSIPIDPSSKALEPATATATVANTSTLSSNTSTLHSSISTLIPAVSSPKADENDNHDDNDSIILESLGSPVSSDLTETLSSIPNISILPHPTSQNPPRQSEKTKKREQLNQEINNFLGKQHTIKRRNNKKKIQLQKTINEYAKKARELGVILRDEVLSNPSLYDPLVPLRYIAGELIRCSRP